MMVPPRVDLSDVRGGASAFEPDAGGDAADGRTGVPALAANEELWVIQRPGAAGGAAPNDDVPGSGALVCKLPVAGESAAPVDVPVPLKHTDVKASIVGAISAVHVTQQFHNPFSEKIEAVYVFPLPENAAVNEFVMTVGERTIRGIIREKEEAQKIYNEAKSQGYVASLLTQERPNIFTQHVANIEPGKAIDVRVTYFSTLAYYDGWYEFVFPMVVGPRFNPPGSAEGIGAVGRGERGASGQGTEVQYLRPGERSGHDIALAVEIDAGVEIEEFVSRSHVIDVKREASGGASVRLSAMDSIPNKDFVLRYRVAGEGVKSGLLAHRDERGGEGGFFTLMLVPPAELEGLERKPVEMVFVVDCSGSMSGRPIEQAKAAVKRGLSRMRPGDSFQVIDFSMSAGRLADYPLEATAQNVKRGMAHVDRLDGRGGTMMIEGIRAALDFPHDPERLRFVAFLTDGYIGNEREILGAVHDKLGASRIFSFGVGSSPNRYLMDSMAKLGRGVVAYLGHNDPATDVMDLFFDRVSRPALTDVRFDWGSARVNEAYPRVAPDLFVGRPVVITGRFEGELPERVRVVGSAGGRRVEIDVPVREAEGLAATAMAPVWARMKIADLSDRAAWDAGLDLASEVRSVALEYGLMSAFTAFVAVDSTARTEGSHGVSVAVPAPVPEGVRYETAVGGGG